MSLIFHVRGDSLDARFSRSGGAHGKLLQQFGGSAPVDPALLSLATAGVFGGSVIDVADAANKRDITYRGEDNWTETANFSVLVRIVPLYSGFPAIQQCIWSANAGDGGFHEGATLQHLTNGKLRLIFWNSQNGQILCDSVATWSPTAGVPQDIMVTWDGTANAGAVKISIEGVQFDALTAGGPVPSRNDRTVCRLVFGSQGGVVISNYYYNEIAIWNDIQNHVYAARTGFLASTAVDPTQWSDPGASNVSTGIAYTAAGVAKVGTRDSVTNVFNGNFTVNGPNQMGSVSETP